MFLLLALIAVTLQQEPYVPPYSPPTTSSYHDSICPEYKSTKADLFSRSYTSMHNIGTWNCSLTVIGFNLDLSINYTVGLTGVVYYHFYNAEEGAIITQAFSPIPYYFEEYADNGPYTCTVEPNLLAGLYTQRIDLSRGEIGNFNSVMPSYNASTQLKQLVKLQSDFLTTDGLAMSTNYLLDSNQRFSQATYVQCVNIGNGIPPSSAPTSSWKRRFV